MSSLPFLQQRLYTPSVKGKRNAGNAVMYHNLYFYNKMMEEIRDAIEEHRFAEYKAAKLAGMEGK